MQFKAWHMKEECKLSEEEEEELGGKVVVIFDESGEGEFPP